MMKNMGTESFGKKLVFMMVFFLIAWFSPQVWGGDDSAIVRVNIAFKTQKYSLNAGSIAAVHGAKKVIENPSINVATYTIDRGRYAAFQAELLENRNHRFH